MDAPPGKEDVGPYMRVAGMLQDIGVHGPRILERSERDGFLLLTDLGTTMYLPELTKPGQADPAVCGRAGRTGADPVARRETPPRSCRRTTRSCCVSR